MIKTAVTPRYIDSLNERAYREIRTDMAKSLVMLTNAEQYCLNINYVKGLAVNYLYQAEVFSQRGYAKRALALYNRSFELSKQNHDVYNIARADVHISSIKRKDGDYQAAESLLTSSLAIFKNLHKQRDIVDVQLRLGVIKEKQKKFDDALQIYRNTCQLAKNIKYLYGEKKTYFNRAELYSTINNLDSAQYYYHLTLHIDTLTKDPFGKALSYMGLSKLFLKGNQQAEAVQYAGLAEAQADSIHAGELQIDALELLVQSYTKQNNVNAIISWQQKLLAVERSQNEADRNDAELFVEVLKHQQEKQLSIQKEISEIQKISQTKSIILLCFMVVMVIVILLIVSVSYNYHKAKAYANELNEKNTLINNHAASVAILNEKITGQNAILEEDNKLKNKLLSVISHDLRHPLTNTKSILDLVNLKLVTQEEMQDLFGQLEGQYTRAVTLLDNMLFWIKSQVHGNHIKKTTVNISALASSLFDEQKMALQKKDITAINEIDPEIEWYADSESLKIVFRNLLTNAIKFTRNNGSGKITFSADTDENEYCISVKDNGIGMDAITLERVNEDNTYTSKGTANEEGSGLGLMLIRDLIKKMDGRLLVKSNPGEGSTFTIKLVKQSQPVLQEVDLRAN